MTKYARITSSTGAIIEEKDEAEFRGGKPPAANVAKDWEWLPLVIDKPSYNSETEVLEGPKDVVTAEKITRKWTVSKLSDKEIAANKDATYSPPTTVMFKLAMDQENRIRALESKSALDVAGFQKHLRDNF